jgi:hypothetical protein
MPRNGVHSSVDADPLELLAKSRDFFGTHPHGKWSLWLQ